jgi:hypothetical protein
MAGVALTGCSGAASPLHHGGPAVASKSAVQESPADPNAGLLDGTALRGTLLDRGALPGGFHELGKYRRDSGSTFGPPSTGPVATAKQCRRLGGTSWIMVADIGSAAFAQDDFQDSYGDEFAEEADSFRGHDAQTVLTRLWQAFGTCAHYRDKQDGNTAKITVARSRLAGGAVKAVSTSPAWLGGQTIVAIRVGHTVVPTLYSSSKDDQGAAAVRLAEKIAGQVRSAS